MDQEREMEEFKIGQFKTVDTTMVGWRHRTPRRAQSKLTTEPDFHTAVDYVLDVQYAVHVPDRRGNFPYVVPDGE